jgi:hypothetical protein
MVPLVRPFYSIRPCRIDRFTLQVSMWSPTWQTFLGIVFSTAGLALFMISTPEDMLNTILILTWLRENVRVIHVGVEEALCQSLASHYVLLHCLDPPPRCLQPL